MGQVEKLFPRKDGPVCTVELKTQKGKLCRPIQRLHQLAVSKVKMEKQGKNKVKVSTGNKRLSPAVRSPNINLQ